MTGIHLIKCKFGEFIVVPEATDSRVMLIFCFLKKLFGTLVFFSQYAGSTDHVSKYQETS